MIISAHQPAYNPWLGLIHKILLSDIFVVMDDVQFEKNSFINRNKILQNSNEVMLTIPVKTKDYKNKTLKEIEVVDARWQIKHLKNIEQAYKKSKNFDSIFEHLKKIYEIKSNFLIDYTHAYLDFIVNSLEIETKIILASDLKIKSKKLNYVVELTQKLEGTTFVFGSQGKDYADVSYMQEKNITAYFQEYKHPTYTQTGTEFHPYMGVIDLLFNEEKSKIKDIILSKNMLKNELRSLNV
jgi:hypothetical protein